MGDFPAAAAGERGLYGYCLELRLSDLGSHVQLHLPARLPPNVQLPLLRSLPPDQVVRQPQLQQRHPRVSAVQRRRQLQEPHAERVMEVLCDAGPVAAPAVLPTRLRLPGAWRLLPRPRLYRTDRRDLSGHLRDVRRR